MGVLPDLARRHELLLVAGGDAYDALSPMYPVVSVPTLRYEYGEDGRRCVFRTFNRNYAYVKDVLFGGPSFRAVKDEVAKFRPDVAICDAEPWTHRVATKLRVPRISFDHYGILAYCKPKILWRDGLRYWRDVIAYRLLLGNPDRVIVSSFYDAPKNNASVRVVGPLLRDEVCRLTAWHGAYLLTYFNQGHKQFTPRVEHELHKTQMPIIIYGTKRTGSDGRLTFREPSNLGFLEDLAHCRAVVATAGNQLVGEALFLNKPMLVIPENTVEQRVNALAVERLGIGMQVAHEGLRAEVVQGFLAREDIFRENTRKLVRDGRAAAVAALEGFAKELLDRRRKLAPARSWTYA
jgi:uncharacterized protein (TIGR00661 family)